MKTATKRTKKEKRKKHAKTLKMQRKVGTVYTYESLKAAALRGNGRVTITLAKNDSAWCPTSSERWFYTGATIEYTFHADGGVDAYVSYARQRVG